MPELPEEMYCSQQICIPPTFPYLLRQYAKAAIRSQPVDLLKWSTAYFRCLALNIPPPVKPRLEYPIPRDYVGITPGWLRALNYQLHNNKTVTFRILWDRWMGSCLEHSTLLEVLCLGGFTNNKAIPWNRFIALCASFLTDNLTQTMILICEILTEEPEGGSAMVTLEVFLDLYRFLASIEGSQPRIVPNLYFTDDDLNLFDKEVKVVEKVISDHEIESVEYSMPTVEEYLEEQMIVVEEESAGSVISCPDLATDEVLTEPEIPLEPTGVESVETIEFQPVTVIGKTSKDEKDFDDQLDEQSIDETDRDTASRLESDGEPDVSVVEKKESLENVEEEETQVMADISKVQQDILEKGGIEIDEDAEDADKTKIEGDDLGDMSDSAMPEDSRMRIESISGETDMGEEMMSLPVIEEPLPEQKSEVTQRTEETKEDRSTTTVEEEESEPEDVHIPAIPGIGPVVPKELVDAVVDYLKKVSAEEHGMTMPRHIRHYTCPPLEVFD